MTEPISRIRALTFTIDQSPVPKGRPRARLGQGGRVIMYTDAATRRWEAQVAQFVALAARQQRVPLPLEGPLEIEATFFIERPKSVKRPLPSTSREDLDNLVKAVLDGMQSARIFRDDHQFVDATIRKRYADGRRPGVVVDIYAL